MKLTKYQAGVTLAFLLLVGWLTTACGSAPAEAGITPPTPSPAATSVPVHTPALDVDNIISSPDYGVQVYLFWREEVADRYLKLVNEMQFRWVKQEIPGAR